jgi:hypothetical protein
VLKREMNGGIPNEWKIKNTRAHKNNEHVYGVLVQDRTMRKTNTPQSARTPPPTPISLAFEAARTPLFFVGVGDKTTEVTFRPLSVWERTGNNLFTTFSLLFFTVDPNQPRRIEVLGGIGWNFAS